LSNPTEVSYKIRQIPTGNFSTGTHAPTFVQGGKVWRNVAGVKQHLTAIRRNNIYADCELVELHRKMIQVERVLSIDDFITGLKPAQKKQREEARQKYTTKNKEERYKMFLQLKKEFESETE